MSFNSIFGLGSHSPDANLEGWWPMMDNDASTTVLDYSGNAGHGTLEGGDNTADLDVAGPNSWQASALNLAGTGDQVNLGDFINTSAGNLYAGCRINPASWPGTYTALFNKSTSSTTRELGAFFNTSGNLSYYSIGHENEPTPPSFNIPTGQWTTFGLRRTGSSASFTKNGVAVSGSNANVGTTATATDLIVGGPGGNTKPNAAYCDFHFFSRHLSDAESLEIHSGPEPIVTSGSDSVSGTETEGQTLSASGATWGLDTPFSAGTNGTITYTYQWTRSDDGSGTNEADIGGATSSTYTLQAADVGKFIRRRVRATNDGGADTSADHNSSFSGAIAAGGLGIPIAAYHYQHHLCSMAG